MRKKTPTDELYSAKAHTNTTILIVDANRTEAINIPKWQIKSIKPVIIILFCLCLALITALINAWFKHTNHASEQTALEKQIHTLEKQIQLLETKTSAEIEAKLAVLKKSETSIKALETFLQDRKVRTPKVSFDKSSTAINSNAGGPAIKLSEPIPYLGKFSAQVDHLITTAQNIPFGRPHPGSLSSGFGVRANPFTGRGAEGHGGLDFRGKTGEPITVTANGRVHFAGVQNGYGNVVIVQHRHGFKTYYAHLSAISVTKNQRLKVGDVVGKLGSTGRSTGPHLHYEVRLNNERKDPKHYINFTKS